MRFSIKERVCRALGGGNIFSVEAVDKYLKNSDYKNKKEWAKYIQQPGKTSMYLTSLETDMSKCRRRSFHQLSFYQLEELLSHTSDAKIRKYMYMQRRMHDGSIILQHEAFRRIINKMEVDVIRYLDRSLVSKDDIKNFLTAAMLFGDKHYPYDEDTKAALQRLCAVINA